MIVTYGDADWKTSSYQSDVRISQNTLNRRSSFSGKSIHLFHGFWGICCSEIRGEALGNCCSRPKAEGNSLKIPRVSPLTEGQLIDCSLSSHALKVLLPNLLCHSYKINVFVVIKSGECCLMNNILITWTLGYPNDTCNRQQFILWPIYSLTVLWYKKSETKLMKKLEIINYILNTILSNHVN